MPNAALNAYLAKNYLDGAKADAILARSGYANDGEKKKRKKKQHRSEAARGEDGGRGLRIQDEGDEGWKDPINSDEEAVVVMQEEDNAEKRRSRWNKVGPASQTGMEEEVAADEKPQMAGEDGLGLDHSMQDEVQKQLEQQQQDDSTIATSEAKKSSVRAGLKTKEEMRAERLERERLAALESPGSAINTRESEAAERRKRERDERAQETVYRDATGRIIDIKKDDEDRKRARKNEERREREKKDWNKGQVQLDRAREARKREEEEKHTSFARYSNDERMNKELREIERSSDPALGFLTRKQANKGPQQPTYKGSFPPNRFKIRPGYRWDGVERSNGFESKFFQMKHQRGQRQEEMDAWGKEDM
ncbi:hypothetical protein CBS101457_005852 [Exobasidium rhododendri]|nr:hypothetical protein CBS101457_005852 [Exobasidium rhododendri]